MKNVYDVAKEHPGEGSLCFERADDLYKNVMSYAAGLGEGDSYVLDISGIGENDRVDSSFLATVVELFKFNNKNVLDMEICGTEKVLDNYSFVADINKLPVGLVPLRRVLK